MSAKTPPLPGASLTSRLGLPGALIGSRPLRFLVAGGVNTMFGYGVFAIALLTGLSPSRSLAVSTILGIVFNFLITGSLAFGSRDARRLPAFCLAYGFLFVFNLLALKSLIAAGLLPAFAQMVLVLPISALSYVVQRDFVFRSARNGSAG